MAFAFYSSIIFPSTDAINQKGYGWFLDNLVNNNNGGWPLVIGSNKFKMEDFDPTLVAGKPFTNAHNIKQIKKNFVLLIFFDNEIHMFLGMLTRKFGSSILIGGDVGQDSRNSTRYVIYVRKSSEKICDLQIFKQK